MKKERADKGRPRWTAYLLWSTRRRKELTKEQEDYTFAQIGRVISDEWKKVEGEPLEKLKEEAEKLNFEGIRKLPKEGSGNDSSGSDSDFGSDEDPSFDEKKPHQIKIKREASERSSRARKRPSFFQEYENEEDNLDKILDEFEQEQILEQRTPRAPKPKKEVKNPGSRPRKRKTVEPTYKDDDEIEMETSRSGRVRKIRRRKVFHFGDEDKSEESGSDGGQDDYKPDSDGNDEPDEEFLEAAGSPESSDNADNDENGYPLPLKKRKSGAAMTKEDIEAAKRAAFAAKPHIEVNARKLRKKDYRDEIDTIIKAGEEDYQDFSDDELSQVLKMQNIKKEPETEALNERTDGQDESAETDKVPEDVSLNTPMSKHEADDGNGSADENNENDKTGNGNKAATVNNSDKTEAEIEEGGDLEGSVTAESPAGNFDSDDENQDNQDKSETRGPVNGNSAEQTGSGSANFNKPETGLGMKETSAEEDLLTSTEATSMEEGDEQYKNMIAETQMENIFN